MGAWRYQLPRAVTKLRKSGYDEAANELHEHGRQHKMAETLSADIIKDKSRDEVNEVVSKLLAEGVPLAEEVVDRLASHLVADARSCLSVDNVSTFVDVAFEGGDPDDATELNDQRV